MPITTIAEKPKAPTKPGKPQFDDPIILAERFLKLRYRDTLGRDTLRSWQDHFWEWKAGRYQKLEDAGLEAKLWKHLKRVFGRREKPPKVTSAKVVDVRKALAALTRVEGDAVPMWLGEGPLRRLLAMQNGLVDLDVLLKGEEATVLPHNPLWFSQVILPYAYDPAAEATQWLTFLGQVLEKDEERILLLHEWLGYLLSGSLSLQKFLVLFGPPASGKSTILNVVTALLGLLNVSHVPLDWAFEDRFALVSTLGKLANIAPEGEHINPKAEALLKAFTAGDRITFRPIWKGAFEAFPTARIVFATNAIPTFADRSGATQRRMCVIPFNLTIPEGERDPGLSERLKVELPGIFNLAIRAYQAIERREPMAFSPSTACDEALAAHIKEAQPEWEFLEETCETCKTAGEEGILKPELYGLYRDFCSECGHKPISDSQFARQVKRVFPKVQTVQRRADGQKRRWEGIRFKLDTASQVTQVAF